MMLRSLRRQTFAAASLLLAGLAGAPGCSPKIVAPPEPPEAVRLGDDAFVHEEYEAAIRHYGDYLAVVEHGEYTPRAYYKSAHASYRLGDYPETIATLNDLERRYPGVQWVQVAALRGDAQREMRHAVDAIVAWDAGMLVASEGDRLKLRQRMAAVVGELDNVDLARARREVTAPVTLALLDQEIAARQPASFDAVAEADGTDPTADEESSETRGALREISEDGHASRPGYGAAEYQRGPNRRSSWRNDNESESADSAEFEKQAPESGEAEVVVLEEESGAEPAPTAATIVQEADAAPAPVPTAAPEPVVAADPNAPGRLVPIDAATGEAAPVVAEPTPVVAELVPVVAEATPAAVDGAPAKLVRLDTGLEEPQASPPTEARVVIVEDQPAAAAPAPGQPARLVRVAPGTTAASAPPSASQPAAAPVVVVPLDGLEKLDVPDIGEPLP